MRYALADVMIYVSNNSWAHPNVGTCLRHVSMQMASCQRLGNKIFCFNTLKIITNFLTMSGDMTKSICPSTKALLGATPDAVFQSPE